MAKSSDASAAHRGEDIPGSSGAATRKSNTRPVSRLSAGRREPGCACARAAAARGAEARGGGWKSRGTPGSRPAPPLRYCPSPPRPFPGGTLGAAPNCAGRPGVSVREGRAKRRPGRAWAGALVGGMRCGVQGTKWRRLHPFTLFPYLGVRAERDSDRCWGRGAAAAKEGRGFPSVGLGDDGG